MEPKDLPRTYREAGRVSAEKQRVYKGLFRANLILLGGSAVLTVVGAAIPCAARQIIGVGAGCVLAAIIVWLVLGISRADNEWFDARAVAESLKTMTWRYAMKAPPYGDLLSEEEADDLFLDEIRQVLHQKEKIAAQLECPDGEPEITDAMRRLRAAPLEERLGAYLQRRVRDQKTWYSNKAKQNRAAERLWFWSAFGLQVSALVAGVITAATGTRDVAGLLVALAALVMTWLQVQQSAYLAHSYGSAAQEFAIIESKAVRVNSDSALADYVAQAELAASREHTLWAARNAL